MIDTTTVAQAADTTLWDISTAAGADIIQAAIGADVASGMVPWDVPDYSALHDFVDANMYLDDLLTQIGWEHDPGSQLQADWCTAVMTHINVRLGGLRPPMYDTDPIRYAEWVYASKCGLLESRAKAFGLTICQQAMHDGL
jgi:hypothetical protein